MQSITKFADVAAAKLNIENRREVVRRIGFRPIPLGRAAIREVEHEHPHLRSAVIWGVVMVY